MILVLQAVGLPPDDIALIVAVDWFLYVFFLSFLGEFKILGCVEDSWAIGISYPGL